MSGNGRVTALLGLDIGTTNCKLIAYSVDGREIGNAVTTYQIYHPQPGHAELDPAQIITAVEGVFRQIAPQLSGHASLALAISVQGEAFVPVNAAGEALSGAPISIDMRGADAIAAFSMRPENASALRTAGQTLTALSSLSKFLWLKQAAPAIWADTAQLLCLGEFIMRNFGLTPLIDHSMASRTGLLDNINLDWATDLIQLAGLSAKMLPPVAASATYVGTLPRQTRDRLQLNASVDVFSGGHDQLCAQLGAGVTATDTALYSIGTTECLAITLDAFRPELIPANLPPYPHIRAGKFAVLIGSQSGGRLLDWFAALSDTKDLSAFLEKLEDVPSRASVIPHFCGSGSVSADDTARGAIAGLSFPVTRQELAHAFLEGITLEQSAGLEHARANGIQVSKMRAVGGGAQSSRWVQIKADITGLPIESMLNSNAACTGAALLAGLGSGALACLCAATCDFARPGKTYEPRAAYMKIYAEKRAIYRDAVSGLRHFQNRQSALEAQIAAFRSSRDSEA